MPTVERDISIGEAGDVSIGDLHKRCRRKIEMSPGVQSRDDTPVWREPEEREFACIPAVKLSSGILIGSLGLELG